jgi:hypothetical protein
VVSKHATRSALKILKALTIQLNLNLCCLLAEPICFQSAARVTFCFSHCSPQENLSLKPLHKNLISLTFSVTSFVVVPFFYQAISNQLKKQCYSVPKPRCRTVSEKKCSQVPREECTTVYKENCVQEPVQSCQPVTKQNCKSEPIQV